MILELKCPKGGRPLSGFNNLAVDVDNETSIAGWKIGYLPRAANRGEPIIIPLREIKRFKADLCLDTVGPKISLRRRLGCRLAGISSDRVEERL